MKENKIKIIIYLVLVTIFVGIGLLIVYLTNRGIKKGLKPQLTTEVLGRYCLIEL